ncbi:hypothetical protein [Bradyrhizobium betae]|uniref:Uncharacterized protein n=1 Tax=Bradyrhizobium betae TaxID=244734 RepID=A0A5P6PCH9_9BRAD|nr:hypothetical protein [Bradyrhizobium betae]MCS3729716.1 hypothetical protein [Bradyrhizobium betae]QFI76059.1 hypothetical protein F8237_28875 [Bradyrhizobium betae]
MPVQLIEKTKLRSSVWLTFWDGKARAQLSIQVNGDAPEYDVGDVFALDREPIGSKVELTPISGHIDEDLLLIPRKSSRRSPKLGSHVRKSPLGGFTFTEEERRVHIGLRDQDRPNLKVKSVRSVAKSTEREIKKKSDARTLPIHGTIVK